MEMDCSIDSTLDMECEEMNNTSRRELKKGIFDELMLFVKSKEADESLRLDAETVNDLVEAFCELDIDEKFGKILLTASASSLNGNHIKTLFKWLLSNPSKNLAPVLVRIVAEQVESQGSASELLEPLWMLHLPLHCLLGKNNKLDPPLCSLLSAIYHPKLVTPFVIHLAKQADYEKNKIGCSSRNLKHLLRKYEGKDVEVKKKTTPRDSKAIVLKNTIVQEKAIAKRNGAWVNEIFSAFMEGNSSGIKDDNLVDLCDIKSMKDLGRQFGKVSGWAGWWSEVGVVWAATLPSRALPTTLPPLPPNLPSALATAQAPIPPSTQFNFAALLASWDGQSNKAIVLKLIEWIHFDNINELKRKYLAPIFRIFTTSDLTAKLDILTALAMFITNTAAVSIERARNGYEVPFLKTVPSWFSKPYDTYEEIMQCMAEFIKAGLLLENLSDVFLLESLKFYRMMASLELKTSLPVFTMVERSLIQASVFSHNLLVIDSLCELLLRYRNVNFPFAIQMNVLEEDSPEILEYKSLCDLVLKTLWTGEEHNGTLVVKSHFAFVLLKMFFQRNKIPESSLTDKQWLGLLKEVAVNVAVFIETFSGLQ